MHCWKWQLLLRGGVSEAVDDKGEFEQGGASQAGSTVGERRGVVQFGIVDGGFHTLFDFWILIYGRGRILDEARGGAGDSVFSFRYSVWESSFPPSLGR